MRSGPTARPIAGRCDVAIVGGGPAGMILGLLLARSGVDVVAIEQGQTFAREFRGEALQPGTLRIFDDIGIGDRIRGIDHGAPIEAVVRIGRRHYEFSLRGLVGIVAVPQPLLLEALAGEAKRSPHFELLMGATFKGFIRDGDRIAGCRYALHGGAFVELSARLVVGCDGRFSAVRREAEIALDDFFMPYDLLWFATNLEEHRVLLSIQGANVVAAFPSRAQKLQIGMLIPKGSYPRWRAAGLDAFKRHVADAIHPEIRDAALEALRDFNDVALLPAVSRLAKRWWRPGLLLIGDAAHPMSPVGGQGINVAIQDAVVAARAIANAVRAHALDDAVLAAIEAERRPSIARIQRQQNLVPRLLRLVGPQRLATALTLALRFFASRKRRPPAFARAAFDRFWWGDPPIRADDGPWVAGGY